MWDYTEKTLDHFRNPRNVGKIENPDGTATVGSLACGDALTFQFKLDADGKIAEAKFQTFGCASAIASSSALTEMVIGKTLEEAKQITNQQIADYLGGLPPQKMHCSVMGREALEAAIKNYETGANTDRNLEDEKLCMCFDVSENEVRRVITENGLTSVEEVTNFTKAGGGCGGCKDRIQAILDEINGK
jgi:NifU-like protein